MDILISIFFLVLVLILTTIVTWGVTTIYSLQKQKLDIQAKQESYRRTLRQFTEKLATVEEAFEALDILASNLWEEMDTESIGIYILDTSVDKSLMQVRGASCIASYPIFDSIGSGLMDKIYENERNRTAHFKSEVVHKGEGLLGEIIETLKPCCFDLRDNRLAQHKVPRGVWTLMAVPLTFEGRFIGLLVAVNRKESPEPFNNRDLDEFAKLSLQAAFASNLILVYAERQRQDRIVQELASYAKMQKLLLPKLPSKVEDYRFAAYQTPAMEVSGDFYDYAPLDEDCHRILVIIADASGKNLPACLMTSMCRSFVRCLKDRFTDVHSFLLDLNRLIHANSDYSKFVTLSALMMDLEKNECIFGCAGHTPMMIRKASGELQLLKPEGFALGMWPNTQDTVFDTVTFNFEPGMKICLYSDGINEAQNSVGKLFGEERLQKIFVDSNESPKKTIEAIVSSVKKFSGETPQADDQTILVISRKG